MSPSRSGRSPSRYSQRSASISIAWSATTGSSICIPCWVSIDERRSTARLPTMTPTLIPRPAATLALLRDTAQGPEVLMMRRTHLAEFAGGAYVFPGGAVEDADRDPALAPLVRGVDDAL